MINGMTADEEDGTGQWSGNGDKNSNGINENIVNFCKNKNTQVIVEGTGSLTVPKQVFGCNIFQSDRIMDCRELDSGSDQWLSCDDAPIDSTAFCNLIRDNLNLFDIEVLDDQNNPVQTFTGSQQGTTLQDLEPGTYSVNEIRYQNGNNNQLQQDPTLQVACDTAGFDGAGLLFVDPGAILYSFCIAYEDEQGNDCSPTTIAAGEDKRCIVKNYIRLGEDNAT